MRSRFLRSLLLVATMVVSHAQGLVVDSFRFATGGATYTANAVTFSTTQREARGGALTGVADGKRGIVSFWFKRATSGGFEAILYSASRFRIFFQSDKLEINGYDTSAVLSLKVLTTSTITDTSWHHCLASWDLAANVAVMYLDDVLQTTSTKINTNLWYSGASNWGIGDQATGGVGFSGCLSEVYFNTVDYLDLSITGNRRLFVSATIHPVDLGSTGTTPTGNQPIVFLKGAFGGFNVNSGSGGNFTQTGTLTSCTSP